MYSEAVNEAKEAQQNDNVRPSIPTPTDLQQVAESRLPFELEVKGVVISGDFQEKWSTPRQSQLVTKSQCSVALKPNWGDPLCLTKNAFYCLLFVFHLNKDNHGVIGGQAFARCNAKIRPPKMLVGKTGCFATRSPNRPNPIGLSICQLSDIDESILTFQGVDLIVGTPILDIKPYQDLNYLIDPHYPSWVVENVDKKLQVDFSLAACLHLNSMKSITSPSHSMELIRNTLMLDPRSRRLTMTREGLFANYIGPESHVMVCKFLSGGNTKRDSVLVLGVWAKESFFRILKMDATGESLKLRSSTVHRRMMLFFHNTLRLTHLIGRGDPPIAQLPSEAAGDCPSTGEKMI